MHPGQTELPLLPFTLHAVDPIGLRAAGFKGIEECRCFERFARMGKAQFVRPLRAELAIQSQVRGVVANG